MAYIRTYEAKRGTRWQVMYRIDSQQISDVFTDPDGATQYAALVDRIGGQAAREVLRQRRAAGEGKTEKIPTVTDWVLHHIDQLTGVEEGTKADYRSYVRLSIENTKLGSLPVDVVTSDHVEQWVNFLATKGAANRRGGLGGKSIKNRHALLSAAFDRATKRKLTPLRPDNPARGVKLPQGEREDMTFLTHGEFAIFLAHVPERWRPLVATLAGTGMRWSEATALQIRDVHLDDDTPTLTVVRAWKHTDSKARLLKALPKSRMARRSIGLSPQIVSVLRPLVEGRPHDAFVFTAVRGGAVRHATFFDSVWQVAVANATMRVDSEGNEIQADRRITKRPRIHDMRHTYASWMLALGMPISELQSAMGHEDARTTIMTYGHLQPGHRERAADFAQIALAQAMPELEA